MKNAKVDLGEFSFAFDLVFLRKNSHLKERLIIDQAEVFIFQKEAYLE